MSEEEIKQLKLERDTAIFVAKERLDEIERIKNQKEIFELRYLKEEKENEILNNIIKNQQEDIEEYNDKLNEVVKERNKYLHIINELEKYLIEEIEDYEKQIKYHKKNKDLRSGILDLVGEYEGEKVCFEDMLGKLQELKRSNKE